MRRSFIALFALCTAFCLLMPQILSYAEENANVIKKVSILSHSASTYAGVSNNDDVNSTIGSNDVYYTAGRYDVYLEDTWWQQVIDALDMELLVNNSWSGSCVFMPRKGEASIGYGDRAVNLHNDHTGEEPDVIFVYLGCNDFAYYKDTFGKAEDVNYATLICDNGDGTFSYATPQTTCEAYAIMLHKVETRYPDADIYCLTSTARRDPDYAGDNYADTGQPTEYSAELHKVAGYYGFPIINLENAIPKEAEIFDLYMGDKRAHPNALGMDQITNEVLSVMLGREAEIRHVSSADGTVPEQAVLLGGSYTAEVELTEDRSVVVIMAGEDVTANAYSNGKISIDKVTGDIVIYTSFQRNPSNFRWEIQGEKMVSVGDDNNEPRMLAGAITDSTLLDARFQLGTDVILRHDQPWQLELDCSGDWRGIVFSSDPVKQTTDMYYLCRTKGGQLCFGTWTGSRYKNFGVDLSGLDGQEHVFLLVNKIAEDGSNMVWLYLDGTEIGPMNNYFIGSNAQGSTSNWVSNKDFIFTYMGADGFPMNNCSLSYLSVWENGHHIHAHTFTITAPTCTEQGYTTYTCSACGDSYTADETPAAGHAYDDGVETTAPTYTKEGVKTFTCTACGDTYTEVIPALDYSDSNPYKGKVFSIMGDSISTFAGYIPTADGFNRTHLARYPQDNLLTDVYATWWMQAIVDLDAKLGINDSWRGATVSGAHPVTSGDTGENAAMSNLVRIQNLGSNGTPDVILFYGGTNDIAHVSKIGSFNPENAPATVDLTTMKWDNLADAYAHTLLRMKHYYPDAIILALLPTYTASYYSDARLAQANETLVDICEYYGVPYIDLRDCGITADDLPDGIHPGEHGMDLITAAVIDALLTIDVPEGENVVYSVTHNLSNVTASRGYYKGVSAGTSFEETLTGDNLSVTVTMGGKDITAACYSDGHVFIEKVTGALEITAKSPFSLGNHLQEIPSEAYNNTNLWQVLKPEKGYFKGAEWVSNYSSVTIPVTAGDQLWATSFGASGENGGSMNGIRVTYFDAYGMLATIEPDAVYDEFQQNGYLTVPEGATAVCITMWTNTNAELYLLTLPDGPVLPGSHLQSIPTPVCSGVNLWQVLKPEKGYFKGTTWVDYYSSVTIPVTAGDQLWATSFGASGENGGTINGIRVTYFDAHGMLASLEATEVYEEFQENGCVTVPENAVSVNVVMWNGDASDELYILNLEHNYDDGVETLAPTCTADGAKTYTCEICGSTSTEAIPAAGHTEEVIPAVAPTCTTTGLTEGSHCSICNEVLIAQEGIDALGHSFAVVSIVPTPTAKGYSIYTCTQCSDSYRTAWLHEDAYKGLKIACVGDSITAAYGVTKDKTDYVTLLAQNLGMDYIRLGVSGTTLCTDGSRTCNIGQLTESKLNGADVVTIFMGINDFCAAGAGYYELGDINSRDTSTIYGAMRMWCERIVQLQKTDSLSNTKFYFVTPVICSWNNSVTSGRNWDQSKTNIHGYTLRDMCNAIIEVANCYGISVIDLNILSGMYYVDAANNNTAVFGGDGVHPGEKGHAMMADALANILLQSDLRDDHSHVFGSWITTTWPSCRAGEQQRVCNICFATEGRPLEPNGSHRYRTVVTTATCETAGYTTYTCSICNDSYTADETPAAGHAYDDGVETLAPTCTADGVRTFTCETCGSTSTEAIPAAGHTEEAIPAVAPSCTVTGLTEGVQCSICGEVLTVPSEVAALGHSHIAVITAPTCTEKGFTTYTCSTCGDSYVSDEVGATGHSYDDGVITTTPACTAGGIKTFTCEVCGDSYNEVVSATGHMEEAIPAVAPTCTAPGLTAGVKCSACGEILTAQTEVAALGHSYDDGVETTAPTCTEEGIKTFTCTVCGNVYIEVIATTGHNYTPLVTDSTCTGVGYTTYTCSACGDSYTSDETPASGHSYDDGVETAAPTCTAEGTMTFTCSACGASYVEPVPATGHTQEIIPAVAPTCTATGLTAGMKCSVCGEILTAQTEVPALGHSYNSGVETTEPSCTAAGVKTFTCFGCGNSYTESIPALGHTETTLPAVAPTCTTVGQTEGLQCSVCGTVFIAQEILPALGHIEGEPVITVEPTVQKAGIRSVFCVTCGELIRSESITITGSLYIPGDADDDGRVDIYDALLVMQYSAGWDVTPNLLNADISKDGIVDLYDAVMILQYCAGTSFDSALRTLLEKAEDLSIDVMTIVEHPQDQYAVAGQPAVFKLVAAGAGLQYQWYIDRGNGDGWRPIVGAASEAYIISAVQMTDDGCRYRCGITDAFGRQIMSTPAILYVEPAVELPQTGDQSNLLLWTTLMAVSLCCLVGLVVADKRYPRFR